MQLLLMWEHLHIRSIFLRESCPKHAATLYLKTKVLSVKSLWRKDNLTLLSIKSLWRKENLTLLSVKSLWQKENLTLLSMKGLWMKENLTLRSMKGLWMKSHLIETGHLNHLAKLMLYKVTLESKLWVMKGLLSKVVLVTYNALYTKTALSNETVI